MLRLTVVSQSRDQVALKIEGWVSGVNVAYLEAEGQHWRGQTQRLVLQLDGVQFIDAVGLALLVRWTGEGVALRGGSAFVRALLEQSGLDREAEAQDAP
jgi:anti-anti-sigma regulatory factor